VNDAVRFEASEAPTADTFYPNAVPSSQDLPESFYLASGPPSFFDTPWGTPVWPPIGPDVTGGDITGWDGHANKIPARLCYENMPKVAGVVTFDASTCYEPTNTDVDLWQDFEFTTLNTTNLAANDHVDNGDDNGTWSIANDGTLSTSTSAEKFTPGTLGGNVDSTSLRGLRYQGSANGQDGTVEYNFENERTTLSFGFWVRIPSAYFGTFTSDEPDLIRVRNNTGQNEFYVKTSDDEQIFFTLFSVEQDESAPINIEPDTWYCLTGLYDSTFRLRVYDENGNQVGVERSFSGAGGANEEATQIQFGSLVGDQSGVWGPYDYDDLIVDWTDATFPLYCPTIH
jgi:hypothetical protein